MTPDDAKRNLELIKAFAEGKKIQWRESPQHPWQDRDQHNFTRSSGLYRIKPNPHDKSWREPTLAAAKEYFKNHSDVNFSVHASTYSIDICTSKTPDRCVSGRLSYFPVDENYCGEWYYGINNDVVIKNEHSKNLTDILDWISERLDEEEPKWWDTLAKELIEYFDKGLLSDVRVNKHHTDSKPCITVVYRNRIVSITQAPRGCWHVVFPQPHGYQCIHDDQLCSELRDWCLEQHRYAKKPVFVPWGPDDVPLVCWIRKNDRRDTRHAVRVVGAVGIMVYGGPVTYQQLFENYEYISPANPTEWRPCGKRVQG